MTDLIHGSGGEVVPEQVWDPALNSGQGGMETVQGTNGAINVALSSSNPLSPVSVIGPITIPASGTYNSPSASTAGKQWQTAQTTVSVTTTATANFNFKSQLSISLPDSSTSNFGSTGRVQNTGTGTIRVSDNTYLTITGGSSLYFQVINNDSANAITLNSGVVNVH